MDRSLKFDGIYCPCASQRPLQLWLRTFLSQQLTSLTTPCTNRGKTVVCFSQHRLESQSSDCPNQNRSDGYLLSTSQEPARWPRCASKESWHGASPISGTPPYSWNNCSASVCSTSRSHIERRCGFRRLSCTRSMLTAKHFPGAECFSGQVTGVACSIATFVRVVDWWSVLLMAALMSATLPVCSPWDA